MPAINFKKQFVPNIKAAINKRFAKKNPTIVPKNGTMRKGFRGKVGDTLYLYTGMRTKSCTKIGEVPCKSIQNIIITPEGYLLENNPSDFKHDLFYQYEYIHGDIKKQIIAEGDGFKNWEELADFFEELYGLPVCLKWIKY